MIGIKYVWKCLGLQYAICHFSGKQWSATYTVFLRSRSTPNPPSLALCAHYECLCKNNKFSAIIAVIWTIIVKKKAFHLESIQMLLWLLTLLDNTNSNITLQSRHWLNAPLVLVLPPLRHPLRFPLITECRDITSHTRSQTFPHIHTRRLAHKVLLPCCHLNDDKATWKCSVKSLAERVGHVIDQGWQSRLWS